MCTHTVTPQNHFVSLFNGTVTVKNHSVTPKNGSAPGKNHSASPENDSASGKKRFRPILMTAFTTIGGLIPMAMGNAKMIGISYKPLGLTIVGGLMFSTLVSLVAVPWAYLLFDDLRNYFKRLVGGILIRKSKSQAVAENV